ncbi:MAG: AbrB/MazE/SpoVT family DNA-binding domain-containing protein [Thaumarchaeota archaeon]|nr:AbrB/MazE/SpoVT family DNA-binding domain-containing protein [Nitrososphaerota archaeon]
MYKDKKISEQAGKFCLKFYIISLCHGRRKGRENRMKHYSRKAQKYGPKEKNTLSITIPSEYARYLGIVKGTKLFFRLEDNEIIISKEVPVRWNHEKICNDLDIRPSSGLDALNKKRDVMTEDITEQYLESQFEV